MGWAKERRQSKGSWGLGSQTETMRREWDRRRKKLSWGNMDHEHVAMRAGLI